MTENGLLLRAGNAMVAEQSLAEGTDAGAADARDETPLMKAAARGDLAIVDTLLAAQADVDKLSPLGWTALGLAARHGHAAIVQTLVAAGANVDCVGGQDDSALLLAIWYGHSDVVEVLLGHTNVNVNVVNKANDSALVVACRTHEQDDLVERLVAVGADVNRAIRRAVETNDVATATRLLPLVVGIKDISSRGAHNTTFQPLVVASGNGCVEMVRLLLHAGADVNATDGYDSALTTASAEGHTDVVEMLLAVDGVDVDYRENLDYNTALLMAAWSGHCEIVRMLVAAGVDIHSENYYWRTALIQAVSQGKLDVVETLLALGATVDQEDSAGWSPLVYAAVEANTGILEALLTTGKANIHHTSEDGVSAPYLRSAKRAQADGRSLARPRSGA